MPTPARDIRHGGTDVTDQPCFAKGTRIPTPTGEMLVEDLSIGDLVTALAGPRGITWLGYRDIDLNQLENPGNGYLVRVLKDAFSNNMPHRDLLVTQEHCIFVSGGLIPARMLVNSRSIILDRAIGKYTYYHVELAAHGILFAEGLATESYLDTGNRGNFVNAGTVSMLPDFAVHIGHKKWAAAAAPLTVGATAVEPIWRILNARAQHLGMPNLAPTPVLTDDPDLHLLTSCGDVLPPVRHDADRYFFIVQPGLKALYLALRTGRPSDTVGPFIDDRRELGVLVGDIVLHNGRQKITVDKHLLVHDLPGWFKIDLPAYRWTDGNAKLLLTLNTLRALAAMLEIRIVKAGPYQVGLHVSQMVIAA